MFIHAFRSLVFFARQSVSKLVRLYKRGLKNHVVFYSFNHFWWGVIRNDDEIYQFLCRLQPLLHSFLKGTYYVESSAGKERE